MTYRHLWFSRHYNMYFIKEISLKRDIEIYIGYIICLHTYSKFSKEFYQTIAYPLKLYPKIFFPRSLLLHHFGYFVFSYFIIFIFYINFIIFPNRTLHICIKTNNIRS